MNTWHTMPQDALLLELRTTPKGLSTHEGQTRLRRHGPNELSHKDPPGLARRFFAQMKDPMILVLLGAAALSLAASGGRDFVDAAIILLIVLVNACISISQENTAQRALLALRDLSAPTARVLRDGVLCSLPARELVPGDIFHLEAGDLVPADGRILSCAGFRADESAMTGESAPVVKDAAGVLLYDTPLAERRNMVLSATVITSGRAVCAATATGMDSEVGHIAGLLADTAETVTPLQKKMGEISKTLSFLCLALCGVLFGVGLLQHKEFFPMLLTAVSLAVAAIPEGLPAIVTIVLSMGVSRMARQRAIVKKLPAVETLGAAGVICSDKTGTLTQNKMTVVEVWTTTTTAAVLTIAALCNDAALQGETITGDPTEVALLAAAHKHGLRKDRLEGEAPRVGELPFDPQRKRMTTLHKIPGGYRILVKGAPDVLLGLCDCPPIFAQAKNEEMAARALRVLGVAWRDVAALPAVLSPETLEKDLTFAGLLGLMDPPRPEVRKAVASCYAAGIRPVMITGDHKLTAVAIARYLGILRPGDLALTGPDLDFMPQELLEADIAKCSVFARVSPEHKMRIVRAWQKSGRVVAMTGDGVNDAPALKAADIGCAMGKSGTDVAKGAADLILTDDNFATIVAAVAQGRGIYANIKKSIHYLLSCNIGEMLTIFVATLLNFGQMPLAPVQLLWLNLVTDSLPALALGMEPVEDDVMDQKPRDAHENLFSRAFSLRLAWQGALVGGLTLGAYFLGHTLLSDPACPGAAAGTMAFATLTMSQLFHAYDVRSETRSLLHIGVLRNRFMNRAFLIGMALELLVLLLPPLRGVFDVVAMTGAQWLCVLALAVTPVAVCELVKWVHSRVLPKRR